MRTVVDAALDAQAIEREKGQEDLDLEHLVSAKTAQYRGMSDEELCTRLGVKYDPANKSLWVILTYRMLGITSNKSSEFMKANISVRTIRVESDGGIRESMSLTPFDFSELINETWENSELFTYFDETRFLLVVFKSDGENYRLSGSAFWNMPAALLADDIKKGWDTIRNAVIGGVQFTEKMDRNGKLTFLNNLPKKGDNTAIHIRPHAIKSAYRFSSGVEIGNVKRDASQLPDGQWMTRQSFWLNNDFVAAQIEELRL
jgi:hypothetical protein